MASLSALNQSVLYSYAVRCILNNQIKYYELFILFLTWSHTLRDMISTPPSVHLSLGASSLYLHIVCPPPYIEVLQ